MNTTKEGHMNEYKPQPGDVGTSKTYGRAILVSSCRDEGHTDHPLPHWHSVRGMVGAVGSTYAPRRPLVVIDPEDDADVERLWDLLDAQGRVTPANLSSALCEYANPKPVIEEPTGWGAVVVDDSDVKWTNTNDSGYPWRDEYGNWDNWRSLRVSSPDQIKFPGIES